MAEETFPAYMQRMAALELSHEEILARYAASADELRTPLAGLDEGDLELRRAEGKWMIRECVHHIVSGDDVMCTAILAALGNPGCKYTLDWYDAERWVEMVAYGPRPPYSGASHSPTTSQQPCLRAACS